MNRNELIDTVAEATSGSASDPLTRDDVAKVVDATVRALEGAGAIDADALEDLTAG